MALDDRKQKAVEIIARGGSYTDVGKEFGITRQAAWEWSTDPEFKAALGKSLARVQEQAITRILASTDQITVELIKLATDPNTSQSVRLDALKYLHNRELGTAPINVNVNGDAEDNGDVMQRFKALADEAGDAGNKG